MARVNWEVRRHRLDAWHTSNGTLPINPPLRPGQTVVCRVCFKSTSDAYACADRPFTFICKAHSVKEAAL